jgi:hypothetical protein
MAMRDENIQLKKDAALSAYNSQNWNEARFWQMSLLIDQVAAVSWQLKVLNDREATNG